MTKTTKQVTEEWLFVSASQLWFARKRRKKYDEWWFPIREKNEGKLDEYLNELLIEIHDAVSENEWISLSFTSTISFLFCVLVVH